MRLIRFSSSHQNATPRGGGGSSRTSGPASVHALGYRYIVLTFAVVLLLLSFWQTISKAKISPFDLQREHNMKISITDGFDTDQLLLANEDFHFAYDLSKKYLKLRRQLRNQGDVRVQHGGDLLMDDDPRRNVLDEDDDANDIEIPINSNVGSGVSLEKALSKRFSIFVSVVSYRDPLCSITLRSLFGQALNPGAVYVGLVEQHDVRHGDTLCVRHAPWYDPEAEEPPPSHQRGDRSVPAEEEPSTELVHSHVKVVRLPPRLSKGPVHARYVAAQMYSGESYFLMVDSHSLFTFHWDEKLLRMYFHAGFKTRAVHGPVLAQHPPAWTRFNSQEDVTAIRLLLDDGPIGSSSLEASSSSKKMPFLCLAKYDYPELGYPVIYSVERNQTTEPIPQPFVGAGLLFSSAVMLREVPFDPHLDYLFHGEEILLSARLFTAGFESFAPNETVVKHYYYRREHHKFHNDSDYVETDEEASERESRQARSILRAQYILRSTIYVPPWERHGKRLQRFAPELTTDDAVKEDVEWYGLGHERSLRDFWNNAGVDPDERILDTTRWCCTPNCRS